MMKKNLTHLMARATVMLIAMFCFLGEAKASDVGLYGTYLESYGNSEIDVIRALRPFVNSVLDLKQTKDLVEKAPCLVLENVTQEEAQACADALNAAGATAFAKTMNSKLLPYEYGFENNDLDEEEWSLVDFDNQTPFYPYMRKSGQYSFRFIYRTHSPQYLISPELDVSTELRVSFWYRPGNPVVTFQVGYSTATNDVSAFTWGEEITDSHALFMQYINTFPAGTKYVAVRFNSNDTHGDLYLDNFKFTEAIAPTPKSLPYEYGFENNDFDEEGWSLVNCDDLTLISSSSDNTSSGNYRFDFRYNTNPPQYLISPELVVSTKMNVSFWYTNIGIVV